MPGPVEPPQTPMRPKNGSTPVPDPTLLTNELVTKATTALEDKLTAKMNGDRHVFETRLVGMDRAVDVLAKWRDSLPSLFKEEAHQLREIVEGQITKLEEVNKQQFISIGTQFAERDKRTEQLSLADKTAIAAALQAQKEAAGATQESNTVALLKMENNFAKLIEQQATLLQVTTKSLADQIQDVKEKQDRGEGKTSVSDPAIADGMRQLGVMIKDLSTSRDKTEGHSAGVSGAWGAMLGAAGLAVGLVSMIAVGVKLAGGP